MYTANIGFCPKTNRSWSEWSYLTLNELDGGEHKHIVFISYPQNNSFQMPALQAIIC